MRRRDKYAEDKEPYRRERSNFHLLIFPMRGFVEAGEEANYSPPQAKPASTHLPDPRASGTDGSANATALEGSATDNDTTTREGVCGKQASPEQDEAWKVSSEDECPRMELTSADRLRSVLDREANRSAAWSESRCNRGRCSAVLDKEYLGDQPPSMW